MSEPPVDTATPAIGPMTATDEEWDAVVRASAGGTFAHLAAWRHVLADEMGYRAHFLEARGLDGSLSGVLPLFELRSPIFGRRLVSVPVFNYGGPVGSPEAIPELADRAVAVAEETGAFLVELRTRHRLPARLTRSDRKVTVLLPLPEDSEELWKSFKSKVRSQVRRPMKEDMQTRFGADQLDPFYDVFAHNMRDLGTPVLPRSLFQRIQAEFPEQVVFAAVYDGETPVAGGAGFVFNGEFEITWASSLREYSRSAPNMLLYWSLMEEMIRRGVRTFDFGRCTPGEGTHRFKLQWGGEDQPLPWLVWPPSAAEEGGGAGRAAEMVSSAWQRLPVPLTRRIGPFVARQLPWW